MVILTHHSHADRTISQALQKQSENKCKSNSVDFNEIPLCHISHLSSR